MRLTMRSSVATALAALTVAGSAAGLAGCGQKGPLTPPPPVAAPVTAGEVPAAVPPATAAGQVPDPADQRGEREERERSAPGASAAGSAPR
jgi:predicted small lipoprotein YifL